MQNASTKLLLAALVTAATGCASSQQSTAGVEVAEVPLGAPARLIGCPNNVVSRRDPSDPPTVRVFVRVLVAVDGGVLQVAPSTSPQFRSSRSQSYLDEAMGLASMCRFEPAMQDGEPVAAWRQVSVELMPR